MLGSPSREPRDSAAGPRGTPRTGGTPGTGPVARLSAAAPSAHRRARSRRCRAPPWSATAARLRPATRANSAADSGRRRSRLRCCASNSRCSVRRRRSGGAGRAGSPARRRHSAHGPTCLRSVFVATPAQRANSVSPKSGPRACANARTHPTSRSAECPAPPPAAAGRAGRGGQRSGRLTPPRAHRRPRPRRPRRRQPRQHPVPQPPPPRPLRPHRPRRGAVRSERNRRRNGRRHGGHGGDSDGRRDERRPILVSERPHTMPPRPPAGNAGELFEKSLSARPGPFLDGTDRKSGFRSPRDAPSPPA